MLNTPDNMITKSELKLEIDSHYSETEIFELGMKPLHTHKKDYAIYKKDKKVYFFEKLSENLYRLYCCTS